MIFFPDIKLILLAYILETLVEGLILFLFFQSKNINLSIYNYDHIVSKYFLRVELAFSNLFSVILCDQVLLGFMV